jgi:hypothetical protein
LVDGFTFSRDAYEMGPQDSIVGSTPMAASIMNLDQHFDSDGDKRI